MLIGLNGKKQAGKDTAYQRLVEVCPEMEVARAAFADKLYESAAAALGLRPHELRRWKEMENVRLEIYAYQPKKRPRGGRRIHELTFRQYLQLYGTEAHRDVFGADFWVDTAEGVLDHEGKIVAITDVRFPNEVERVRELGGVVVRVIGPPEVEEAEDAHVSEEPLPPELVDHEIDNSVREFEPLDAQLRALVEELSG